MNYINNYDEKNPYALHFQTELRPSHTDLSLEEVGDWIKSNAPENFLSSGLSALIAFFTKVDLTLDKHVRDIALWGGDTILIVKVKERFDTSRQIETYTLKEIEENISFVLSRGRCGQVGKPI